MSVRPSIPVCQETEACRVENLPGHRGPVRPDSNSNLMRLHFQSHNQSVIEDSSEHGYSSDEHSNANRLSQ